MGDSAGSKVTQQLMGAETSCLEIDIYAMILFDLCQFGWFG